MCIYIPFPPPTRGPFLLCLPWPLILGEKISFVERGGEGGTEGREGCETSRVNEMLRFNHRQNLSGQPPPPRKGCRFSPRPPTPPSLPPSLPRLTLTLTSALHACRKMTRACPNPPCLGS